MTFLTYAARVLLTGVAVLSLFRIAYGGTSLWVPAVIGVLAGFAFDQEGTA